MGDYVKYRGEKVEIGTGENMYYTSYQKYVTVLNAGFLSRIPGNEKPDNYALPNFGCRFRFPFPDEDKMSFGEIIEPFDRGLIIRIDCHQVPFIEASQQSPDPFYELMIIQQKLVTRLSDAKECLALVCTNQALQKTFRIDDDKVIKELVDQIIKNHITEETRAETRNYFKEVGARILAGYGLENPLLKIKETKIALKPDTVKPTKKKFKRGL